MFPSFTGETPKVMQHILIQFSTYPPSCGALKLLPKERYLDIKFKKKARNTKKGAQEIQKGVQREMEMVCQIDHGCHVTSLTSSENTLSLFIFSPLFPPMEKK